MKVKFLSGFEKDLSQTHDKVLAQLILDCIELFERVGTISEVPNVKRLKGHKSAYRYRKGKYRIGFYLEDEIPMRKSSHQPRMNLWGFHATIKKQNIYA
jgi:mRNA interferase RelE/StbE